MFNNNCLKCGSKVAKNNNFCSNCGFDLSKNYDPRDYGMIGRDDNGPIGELPMSLGSIINGLMNEMNKQINKSLREGQNTRKVDKQEKSPKIIKQSGISINISSSGDGQPRISIKKVGGNNDFIKEEFEEIEEIIPSNKISEEKARMVAKLPKEEAKSSVKRFDDKLIYEIQVPGVKKLEDIIINKLEESIEVKAFSEKTSYFKNLPVNLPITNYKLSKKGVLTIELLGED